MSKERRNKIENKVRDLRARDLKTFCENVIFNLEKIESHLRVIVRRTLKSCYVWNELGRDIKGWSTSSSRYVEKCWILLCFEDKQDFLINLLWAVIERIKNDSKFVGLSNWKSRVAIYWREESKIVSFREKIEIKLTCYLWYTY